jgi:hypothetical protein
MPTRFDGFYIVRYEGLIEDGKWGFGTLTLKDGKMYGGDSLSCFMGEFIDGGKVATARARIFPIMQGGYESVTGFENKPWDIPDIRGVVPEGVLPPNVHVTLDGQRYDKQAAVIFDLWRVALI